MTTVAFNQYCNISFTGGSYITSPIKNGINIPHHPNDVQARPIDNGIQTAKHSNPPKFGISDSSASFAMERKLYTDNFNDDHMRRLKATAIGSSTILPDGEPLSYKRTNLSEAKRALAKVRSHGSVAPAKKGALENTFTSIVGPIRGFIPPSTSAKSAGWKHSAFMSRHAKARLACPVSTRDNCMAPTSTNIETATYNNFPENHQNQTRHARVIAPPDDTGLKTSIFMPHYIRYRVACDDCPSYTANIQHGAPIVTDDNKFSTSLPDHIKNRIGCGDC